MENNQFNELVDNFFKSNEQLEKALEILSEYSQKQKKADATSLELIEALEKSNVTDVIDISDAMKKYVEASQKQMIAIEKTLKSLATDVGGIKKKIEDIEVLTGLIMKNTEVGFAKLEKRIGAIEIESDEEQEE